MDIHNVFLYGDLEEEVYVKFPPNFHNSNPNIATSMPTHHHPHPALPEMIVGAMIIEKNHFLEFGFGFLA